MTSATTVIGTFFEQIQLDPHRIAECNHFVHRVYSEAHQMHTSNGFDILPKWKLSDITKCKLYPIDITNHRLNKIVIIWSFIHFIKTGAITVWLKKCVTRACVCYGFNRINIKRLKIKTENN